MPTRPLHPITSLTTRFLCVLSLSYWLMGLGPGEVFAREASHPWTVHPGPSPVFLRLSSEPPRPLRW